MASDAEVQSTSKRKGTSESSGSNAASRKRQKTVSGSSATDGFQPAQFVDNMSDEVKCSTLRHMLDNIAANPTILSGGALVTIACEHGIKRQKKALLMSALQLHRCTWACLIHYSDAQEAGHLDLSIHNISPPLDCAINFPANKLPTAVLLILTPIEKNVLSIGCGSNPRTFSMRSCLKVVQKLRQLRSHAVPVLSAIGTSL
ncbi:hypothetical protein B0H10DRAFT_1083301 [Mycena sp. CBHHK59/15]|nr:hypothetical protein B0H10DRAFT_1083301 [Mycena sp. CBHHK59/15]